MAEQDLSNEVSYVDLSEGIRIMRGFENLKWLDLLRDHREYLLSRSTPLVIDDQVFEQEQKRPLIVLRRSGITSNIAMEVLFLNDVSLAEGFKDDKRTIMIPKSDDIDYLERIFAAS